MNEWRKERFDGLAGSTLTTAQVASVTLGDPRSRVYIDPGPLALFESPFAMVRTDPRQVDVPFMLGTRRIALVHFEHTTAGWEIVSETGEPALGSAGTDARTKRAAMRALSVVLGGPAESTVEVDLLGSTWILARHGDAQAAAVVKYSPAPTIVRGRAFRLPPLGAALTARQFQTLVARMW